MNQPIALQSALVFVRQALPTILNTAVQGHGALAEATRTELEGNDSVHVQRKLRAGDLLGAASSAKASDAFRDVLEDTLSLPLHDLREALLLDLQDVLSGERLLRVPVDRARAQHLPRAVVAQGFLDAQSTREVAVAAPMDAALLAQWALIQVRPDRSTALGFVQYAANNSAFMNRLELFGARVRLGEDQAGRPMYDYQQAVTTSLQVSLDSAGDSSLTLGDTLSAAPADRDAGEDLEYALFMHSRALLGQVPGRPFSALFSQLCAAPDLRLSALEALHTKLAAQYGLPVQRVRELAQALDQALLTMRQTQMKAAAFIQ